MTNTISFAEYKAAADRIRSGKERAGDHDLCEAYDRQPAASVRIRSVMDLPMARACWESDVKDGGIL